MKIKISEIAKEIQKENPEAFGNMNEKRIVKLIRATFKQLKSNINTEDETKVQVQGLGQFKINQVKANKNTENTKRIVFTPRNIKGK